MITSTKSPVLLERPRKDNVELWLAIKVLSQPTVRVAIDLFSKNRQIGGMEVGQAFEAKFQMGVSEASQRRYGSGVLVWVNWLEEIRIVNFDRAGTFKLFVGDEK